MACGRGYQGKTKSKRFTVSAPSQHRRKITRAIRMSLQSATRIRKNRAIVEGLALDRFAGPDGLMLLLSMIAERELPPQELIELAKRVQIPGYEAVYEMVHDAVSEGVITPYISAGFYLQCEIREVLEWAKYRNLSEDAPTGASSFGGRVWPETKIERPLRNPIEETSMAVTTEIAPNIYRISIFAQSGNLQFNHFLVKDDEPLLFHTGLRGMHSEIREAVSKLIDLGELRHISFSHFESDECGSVNEWLAAAPKADVICSQVGALVCVNDFTGRESRAPLTAEPS